MKSQIFKKKPDINILSNVLKCFNLDLKNFNNKIIYRENYNTSIINNLKNLIPELKKYYLNCKSNTYLNSNLTLNRCFTILRHILGGCNYNLIRKQNYNKSYGKNITLYKIVNKDLDDEQNINNKYYFKIEHNVILKFD